MLHRIFFEQCNRDEKTLTCRLITSNYLMYSSDSLLNIFYVVVCADVMKIDYPVSCGKLNKLKLVLCNRCRMFGIDPIELNYIEQMSFVTVVEVMCSEGCA